eukprot:m.88710 g.88710  ORF g.88710 m.88710 type:complete len:64 (-) comp14952_c0_seq3:2247-2438(-)
MLTCVSPAQRDVIETERSLHYASQASRITCSPGQTQVIVAADYSDPMAGDVDDPDPKCRRRTM